MFVSDLTGGSLVWEPIKHPQSKVSFGVFYDLSYCRPLSVNGTSDPRTAVMFTESELVILYSVKYQHGKQLLQRGEKKQMSLFMLHFKAPVKPLKL